MKLGDIIRPMIALLEDAHAAETHLEQQDSQFARRAYIRSVFAAVEGIVWLLKRVCLKLAGAAKAKLDLGEYSLLQDQTYELKQNGELNVQTKFLRLPDNLRFTFRVFNRSFAANVDLGVGAASWDHFLEALAIRHRITHPKEVDQLDVTDAEIARCKEVCSWFNEIIHSAITSIVKVSKQQKDDV